MVGAASFIAFMGYLDIAWGPERDIRFAPWWVVALIAVITVYKESVTLWGRALGAALRAGPINRGAEANHKDRNLSLVAPKLDRV